MTQLAVCAVHEAGHVGYDLLNCQFHYRVNFPHSVIRQSLISQCTVPNFIDVRLNRAQSIWSNAGFTTKVTTVGPGGHNITSQSLPAGYVGSCTTTPLR